MRSGKKGIMEVSSNHKETIGQRQRDCEFHHQTRIAMNRWSMKDVVELEKGKLKFSLIDSHEEEMFFIEGKKLRVEEG